VSSPLAPPRVARGEAPQPGPQVPVRVRLGGLVALSGTVLANDLTCPPLRDAEPLLEHLHGSTSPRLPTSFPG
jgi:hypothetical protein